MLKSKHNLLDLTVQALESDSYMLDLCGNVIFRFVWEHVVCIRTWTKQMYPSFPLAFSPASVLPGNTSNGSVLYCIQIPHEPHCPLVYSEGGMLLVLYSLVCTVFICIHSAVCLYLQPPLTDSGELSRRPVRLLGINTWDVAAALTHLDWSLFKSIHEVQRSHISSNICMWSEHIVCHKFIFITEIGGIKDANAPLDFLRHGYS